MKGKKVIHSTVEQDLMSLAHEILRSRNRMELADIHAKATRIAALTSPKSSEEETQKPTLEAPITTLEKALQSPVLEAEFETISIDFVQHLFEGNSTDYQRGMSMLNSKETLEEAKKFIEEQVQPEYDWSKKQKECDAFLKHVETIFST